MSNINAHRPAHEWLQDLSKAKNQNMGMKPRVTLQDLQERINDPNAEETSLIPSSPRSVQACFLMGIDPVELQFHPLPWYRRQGDSAEMVNIRFNMCEVVRQERMQSLLEQRRSLIDAGWTSGVKSVKDKRKDENTESSMVEAERVRLEALVRRQEKEIQQMVTFELSRKELADKQCKKVEELEKRAQALVRQKVESDAAWQVRQRNIELQKKRDEDELAGQMKRMMEENARRDREQQIKEAEEDKRRKREAYHKELERRHKIDEARHETEMIAAKQAEDVEHRRIELLRKDNERTKRLEKEAKVVAALNAEKRKKAEERIASALSHSQAVAESKRQVIAQREEALELRRRQLEERRLKDEQARKQEEVKREHERLAKFVQVAQSEEKRRSVLKQKAGEKDLALAELFLQKKRDGEIKRVHSEFELKLRLDKVDSIQKTHLYQRQQLLDKIMDEYETSRKMMYDRTKLQEKRKLANMQAALQRQSLSRAMDNIRGSDISKLASGRISIGDLMRRPHTAMTV